MIRRPLVAFALVAAQHNARCEPPAPVKLWVYPSVPAAIPGGGAAGPYQWLVVDAPLTVTRDAAGVLHLGVALDGRCTIDARNNITCASGSAPPAPAGDVQIRNEIPAPSLTAPGTWVLNSVPTAAGVVCRLNGLGQQPGVDYDLAGAVLTPRKGPDGTPFWPAGAALSCDYAYTPPAIAK